MIQEHDNVVLTTDLPSSHLEAGDIGVVIHIHKNGKAFEVEFLTFDGNTIAIATLDPTQVRPVRPLEIPHVRKIDAA
ncbi:MAG: DUF4926 domain-containing protein [Gammaproteobacteria bacterium]|nr:DUF4926 domain-containing protein [Gammaproteobacteria bacterium]